ncbi:MAG: DNA repair protein RecO [Pirellulaceae bacterium]|jgi:DNA repair protein RecO (recombination protein O)|nr:DNA repair protein RecO [Pirellulaceae bacterium]MDP7016328.1 DNA repair protein RecO [Pirellulaceae bacterium]
MSSEKSFAIVIRVIDFSETSCVVTLFTDRLGKISALAKGARRPQGPFESAIDLLSLCRIVFLHKSSDSLDLLTEAKLEKRFRAAARGLSHLYAGYYVAELLNELTDPADPHPELFQNAESALRELEQGVDVLDTLLRFELTALRVLGHLPSFSICVGCGDEVKETKRVAFGVLAGGVLCGHCRAGHRQVVSVSAGAMEQLRHAGDENAGEENNVCGQNIATPLRGEIRGVMNRFLVNLLGRQLRMHSYLPYQ